ncbi:MAG: serine/threonine protein kinase [Gemmatimonadota bacterium]|nr:MAG: serine/threonine protein kinase [Gemmatimonadota bacterium]
MARVNRPKAPRVEAFEFEAGRTLGGKYEVIDKLGSGWEGEVYRVREVRTGIHRAAKIFFPHRNLRDKAAKFYARKLHKLRHCEMVIQYHSWETFTFRRQPITALVSEFVEGELLDDYLKRQPGKRLHPFAALHLLHALATGMEDIHRLREYHGDLHEGNVIVCRVGLGFELKLLDLYHWESPRPENIREDVIDMIRIFYNALGGRKRYASYGPEIKEICCGLRRDLITARFRSAGEMRRHLEEMEWE